MEFLKSILNSENGVLQIVLAGVLALSALFGIDPKLVSAVAVAAVALVGFLKTWTGKFNPLDSNFILYLVMFLGMALPSWMDIWGLFPKVIEAIVAKDWTLLGGLVLTILNILFKKLQRNDKIPTRV